MDGAIRMAVEKRHQTAPEKNRVAVILTTGGGLVEIAQRIAQTFRHFYEIVEFVIPDCAFSAGTVLVMSGDAIWMDYYSRLGPTDPQVPLKDGRYVPALGYIKKYKALIDKAQKHLITQAEIQLLIDGPGFDPAFLYQSEQSKELASHLIREWLPQYKFRNWTETETKKTKVTHAMKVKRAKAIADALCESDKWHAHGRGISKSELENDPELMLKIDDFNDREGLCDNIRQYHDLLDDYMVKMGSSCIVHIVGSYKVYASYTR